MATINPFLKFVCLTLLFYGNMYSQIRLEERNDTFISREEKQTNISEVRDFIDTSKRDSNENGIEYQIEKVVWINKSDDPKDSISQITCKDATSLDKLIKDYLSIKYDQGHYNVKFKVDTLYQWKKKLIVKSTTELGRELKIRSIRFYSDDKKMNLPFIYKIAFRTNENLNTKSIETIKSRINGISFVELVEEPSIKVTDSTIDLILKLRERQQNQFYALLGILSDAYGSNNVKLTGDAILSFNNLFHRGVYFDLNWQKTITSSQFLFLKTSYPYMFSTPFGLASKFSLEAIDSQYLRVAYDISLEYHIDWNQVISITYRNQSSSIENIDKNEILNGRLPKSLDFSTRQFGIGYRWTKLDKPIFSRKGFNLELQSLIGTRTIIPNQTIEGITDANGMSMKRLYDSINLVQTNLSFNFLFESYVSLSKKIGLKNTINSKGILADEVRLNEMFFLGGIKRPRGFDDNMFLSPMFLSLSTEIQYFFNEYFYYNIFADMSIIKSSIESKLLYPYGIGSGISLKSKGSIINLSFAYGFSNDQSFSINRSKIHIGYVGIF